MTQPPAEPPELQDPAWPVSDERVVLADRESTVVAPPQPPPRDRTVGPALLALGFLVLVAAGIAAAFLLSHRGSRSESTTIVVTTAAPATSAPETTPRAVVPPATATTAPVTTSEPQTTTAAAPAAPTTATVPDVAGQTEQAAVTSFSKAGVLPSLVWVPNQAPLGSVVQQAKSSGTTVPYHAHVQLNLSRGPGDKADLPVPDVVGKTLTDAVAAINAAHLRVLYVRFLLTSKSQAGTIVQQSPLAGGKAPENAQVLVFLGAYRP